MELHVKLHVAKIVKLQAAPVYRVALLALYGVCHERVGYMVAVAKLYLYVTVLLVVEVENGWYGEIKLPLLERVSRLEAHLYALHVVEYIAHAHVKLIGEAAFAAIAKIKGVEERVYA